MRSFLLALSGLFIEASLIALPISDQIADPHSAFRSKYYSPNGVYGFWMSSYRDCCGEAPIMDGPLGLRHPADERDTEPMRLYTVDYTALVNNSGLAVASIVDDGQLDLMMLLTFSYWDGYGYLQNYQFIWPSFPSPVSIEGGITPLTLSDTVFTARLNGLRGDGVRVHEVARWDLVSGGLPVIIPEPATYVLMTSALVLLASVHRRRAMRK